MFVEDEKRNEFFKVCQKFNYSKVREEEKGDKKFGKLEAEFFQKLFDARYKAEEGTSHHPTLQTFSFFKVAPINYNQLAIFCFLVQC